MKRIGKVWWSGSRERRGFRRWLYFGESGHVLRFEIGRLSWSGIRFKWGMEDYAHGVQLSAGIGWWFWLTWEMPYGLMKRLRFPAYERVFSLEWNHGELRLGLFSDDWGDSIGMTNNRHVLKLWRNEWVTGRRRHTRRTVAETTGIVDVGQWEGDAYPVRVRIEETVSRNRFRTRRSLYAWMDVDRKPGEPFPVTPGNIDSDFYDGDDGIFGTGCDLTDAGDVQTALASYANAVRRERLRRGGEGWRPRSMREAVS